MTNGTLAGFILLTIGSSTGMAGCSESTSPSAPARISPPPETGPALTQFQRPATRLYGVVSDTAFRPLAGARIEIVGGPETGVWTTERRGRVLVHLERGRR